MARRKRTYKKLWLSLGGAAVLFAIAWPLLRGPYHRVRCWEYERKADAARAAREFQSAELFAFNALRHQPRNASVWALLGRIRQEGDLPGAAPALVQAFATDPANAAAGLAAVDASLAAQGPATTLPLAQEVARRHPSASSLQRVAVCLAQTGKSDAALEALTQAFTLEPHNPSVAVSRGAVLAVSTNAAAREEGQRLLDTLSRGTNDALAVTATASLAASLNQTDPARALLLWEALRERQPGHWLALVQRANLRERLKSPGWENDLQGLRLAADTPRKRLDTLMLTRLRQGPQAGLAAAERLPKSERGAGSAGLIEAACLGDLNRWPEVIALCDLQIRTAPDTDDRLQFVTWKVRALKATGDTDAAGREFAELSHRLTAKPAVAGSAAMMFESWKLYDEAVRLHQLAARAGGEPGRLAWQHAVACAIALRNAEPILDLANQYLAAYPNDPFAANLVANYLLVLGRDPARALQLTRKAVTAQPKVAEFRETLATALTVNQRAPEALDYFAALPAKLKEDPSVKLHQAEALAAVGRKEEARALASSVNPARLLPQEQTRLADVTRP